MKRPLNFYDGLVLLLLFCHMAKLTAPFPLWHCAIPWVLEGISHILSLVLKYGGAEERLNTWLIRQIVAYRTKRETRKILKGK